MFFVQSRFCSNYEQLNLFLAQFNVLINVRIQKSRLAELKNHI